MAGKVTKSVMYTPLRIVRLWPGPPDVPFLVSDVRASTSATIRSCSR